MLTEEEALEKMRQFFKIRGLAGEGEPSSVRLITRKLLEEDPHGIELKISRPDAWNIVRSTFRDHWCVMFKRSAGSPPYDIINIDAETGEVTVPPLL